MVRRRRAGAATVATITKLAALILAGVAFAAPAWADQIADMLAPQIVYMEACEGIAPPPSRHH